MGFGARRGSLRAHEALHLRRDSPLRLDQSTRSLGQARGHLALVHLHAQDLLEVLAHLLEVLLGSALCLLLLVGLLAQVDVLLGRVDDLQLLVRAHALQRNLVDLVEGEEHLEPLALEPIEHGRGGGGGLGGTWLGFG